jgi:hypothetical protein
MRAYVYVYIYIYIYIYLFINRSHNSLAQAAAQTRKKEKIIATQAKKMKSVDFDEDGEVIEREMYDPRKKFGKYWGRFSDTFSESKRKQWTEVHTRKTVNERPRHAVDFGMLPSNYGFRVTSSLPSVPPTPVVSWP